MNSISNISFSSLEDVCEVCRKVQITHIEDGDEKCIRVDGYSGSLTPSEFYKLIAKYVLDEGNMGKGNKKTYDTISACLKKIKQFDSTCDQSTERVYEIESIFQSRLLQAKL